MSLDEIDDDFLVGLGRVILDTDDSCSANLTLALRGIVYSVELRLPILMVSELVVKSHEESSLKGKHSSVEESSFVTTIAAFLTASDSFLDGFGRFKSSCSLRSISRLSQLSVSDNFINSSPFDEVVL